MAMIQTQEHKVFGKGRHKLLYTDEEAAHFQASLAIAKYLERKATASPGSAKAYASHLRAFAQYIYRKHGQVSVDGFIDSIKKGELDAYDNLASFAAWLQRSRTGEFELGANIQRDIVKTAKRFMRFSKVPVTNEDFREQVSLPRREEKDRKPVAKKTVIKLLNACDVQLKTFCMFSAVFGPRPIEASAVRNRDIDLASEPGKVTFRAKYSKMRKERTRYMTKELKQQMELWKAIKYKPHRTTRVDPDGTERQEWVTPKENPDELFFQHWNPQGLVADPNSLYDQFQAKFAEAVEHIEPGWEESGKRREITLYSFRRFAKTTISDLGLEQFSEYWIGHKKSVYWNKPVDEIIATFKRIEPYLTFLDISQLEAQGADIASKIEEKDQLISSMLERMKKMEGMIHDLQQEKYRNGEIVMEDAPELKAEKGKKRRLP